jgi:hypothetical protein
MRKNDDFVAAQGSGGKGETVDERERFSPGFVNHINYYVRDVNVVLPLYDALFGALGLTRAPVRSAAATYARWSSDGVRIDWFNVYEDASSQVSNARVAFRARSPVHVDEVRAHIRDHAINIEGPEAIVAYDPSYYGVSFEDALGNKFEVCYCTLRR